MSAAEQQAGAWLSPDQLSEFHRLRLAEQRRVRQRQLRQQGSPVATGRRVVSMLQIHLGKLAEHVAAGAIEPGQLRALRASLDDSVNVAIGQLREQGYSWPEIGRELGITHQVAHKRWQRHQTRQAGK